MQSDFDENFFGYVSEDFKDFIFTQKFLKKKNMEMKRSTK